MSTRKKNPYRISLESKYRTTINDLRRLNVINLIGFKENFGEYI